MKKLRTYRIRHTVLLCCLYTFLTGVAYADSPAAPYPYQFLVGAEQEFVFHMHPQSSNTTAASGLYRNNGDRSLLWGVDWYAFGVSVGDDGRTLIRHGPWASSTHQLAVAFYDQGNLIRAYNINELVSDEQKLSRTVSHFSWSKKTSFDAKTNVLAIRTVSNDRYLFDARRGEIILTMRGRTPALLGDIEHKDGKATQLRDLRVCFSEPWLIGLGATLKIDAVALQSINTLHSMPTPHDDSTSVKIVRTDGSERLMNFEGEAPHFCGRNNEDQEMIIAANEIRMLTVRPPP